MTIDLLPTLAKLAGGEAARSIRSTATTSGRCWRGSPSANGPHEAFYFYWGTELQAVRGGKWKLHFPHAYQSLEPAGADGLPGKYVTRRDRAVALRSRDRSRRDEERRGQHPDVVTSLMVFVERAREDLGDALTKRPGTNLRPAGTIAPVR